MICSHSPARKGGGELLDGMPDDLAARVAEDPLRSRVPGQDAPVVAEGDDGLSHALDEPFKVAPGLQVVLVGPLELRVELGDLLVLLLQGILGLLDLGV